MSLSQFLSAYLNLNLLLVLGFLFLKMQTWIQKKWKLSISSAWQLRSHYQVLLLLLIFVCLQPFFPRSSFFEPPVKQWASSQMNTATTRQFSQGSIALSNAGSVKAETVTNFGAVVMSGIFLFALFWMTRDFWRLHQIQKNSYRVRHYRSLNVSVHDSIQVPFSYWLPGKMHVVLPTQMLARPQDFRMAVLHEIQHHRQGDTRWVYVLWTMRLLCLFNPVIYFWNRWLCEIQEFACDETLVDHKKVPSQAYARCLVEVAQTAALQKFHPACASGMAFLQEKHILQRRIEKMFSKTKNQPGRSIGVVSRWVSVTALVSMMVATSYAANGWILDRRVTMAQAKTMVAKAQADSSFPIVLNGQVLEELNAYLGTPEGRDFMKESLQRMQTHQAVVQEALKKYGVPTEIAAVPIVESGYQNLAQKPGARNKSAGIWQFIPATARNFGLRVDGKVDERMNVVMATDAALRYLQSNHLRFKDWQLAMLAYNMGEVNVQNAIDKVGSSDAWALIGAGYEGDSHYLAKIMAVILILKNPESLQ
jgi:beta-lactamase regulating signal transducer with metallopeptidase domain